MTQLVLDVVNPTHVGMDRSSTNSSKRRNCKPHARGDGPGASKLNLS